MVASLLCWYDAHARRLPWRMPPAQTRVGHRPEAYPVWLSEAMLQQTTVTVASRYFEHFISRWPTVEALAQASNDEVMAAWAGLGYYARARNLIKCARTVVELHGGEFPNTETGLATLPGIGPYTAAAIASIAFDRPVVPVDGNVERIMARLHAVSTPLPRAKAELRLLAARFASRQRPGDFAQAMMDLGSMVCRPGKPDCASCPWSQSCQARELGIESVLPARVPKPKKPEIQGRAYVGRRIDGAWLVERRPESGLLGGMLGWPGSGWGHEKHAGPPWDGDWSTAEGSVTHVFTHFRLDLEVLVANIPVDGVAERGEFMKPDSFDPDTMPSLMRKVFALASTCLDE